MITIIHDDLLNSKEKYIAHICNCCSTNSAGVAKAIFDKYPYSNTYQTRASPSSLGTFEILGNGKDQRLIINIYSMFYPGKPKYPESEKDGTLARQNNFYHCLLGISKIPDLESIAFPYGVGCNLAGGNWNYYLGVLQHFDKFVNGKHQAKVFLYKK